MKTLAARTALRRRRLHLRAGLAMHIFGIASVPLPAGTLVAWTTPVLAQAVQAEDQSFIKRLRLARTGDAAAQLSVALDYENGTNQARKDPVQAAKWYREAAILGNLEAQFRLSKLMITGAPGIDVDADAALKLLRSAAEKGHPASQNELGLRFQKGDSVTADLSQAVIWYKKAADQGYAPAEVNLGLLLVKGDGVQQNHSLAFKLFQHAAESGDSWALNNLGSMYEMGWGTETDAGKAREFYERALAKGNPVAASNLARLATKAATAAEPPSAAPVQ